MSDIIVLDTNLYYALINIEENHEEDVTNVDIDVFKQFIRSDISKAIHVSTLYELYSRIFKGTHKTDSNAVEKFIDYYKILKKYDIKLLNEKNNIYFDANHFNSLKSYKDINDYMMGIKINFEVTELMRFYSFIIGIYSEKLFDTYGDVIDVNLFKLFMEVSLTKLEESVKNSLYDYYYTTMNIKNMYREINFILGGVLDAFKDCIKNKKSLVQDADKVLEFINDIIQENKKNVNGAIEANDIIGNGVKEKIVELKISKYMSNLISIARDEGKNGISDIELKYYEYLLQKLFVSRKVIKKNDITDFFIVTSLSLLPDDNLYLLTLDTALREFTKQQKKYYREDLYIMIGVI